jgi:hypothetical protein
LEVDFQFVIPVEAEIQAIFELDSKRTWMPAFAGMMNFQESAYTESWLRP